jgi:hypothetical protein
MVRSGNFPDKKLSSLKRVLAQAPPPSKSDHIHVHRSLKQLIPEDGHKGDQAGVVQQICNPKPAFDTHRSVPTVWSYKVADIIDRVMGPTTFLTRHLSAQLAS